jgi:hypothetical protein
MENNLKQIAIEKLSSPPTEASLLTLISWLDLACATASPASFQKQLLTRAIAAAGYELVKKKNFPADHPVIATIKAAEAYLLAPTDETFAGYFSAATNSYPFGAGEGCYAIRELGYPGCEPGSGCMSGAGSLYNIAHATGFEVVWQSITSELIPWLQDGTDPIALRKLTQ